jgi:hypothetical protein
MRIIHRIRCQAVTEKWFLITLGTGDRSSFQEQDLANLSDDLRALIFATRHPHVMLDLGTPAKFGARLLGILARLASALRDSGRQLAVCGDHQILVDVAGLGRIIATYPTLGDALNLSRQDGAGRCGMSAPPCVCNEN